MEASFCYCDSPFSLIAAKAPFSRILVLEYYDGLVSGLAECKQCLRVYRFDMVAWEGNAGIRVFTLGSVPTSFLQRAVEEYSRYEAPRWPLWVPFFKAPLPDRVMANVEQEIDRLLTTSVNHPVMVVASATSLESILKAKKITSREFNRIQDWFAFLGLLVHSLPLP
ncbi:MAG: hypothetical protein IVW55_01125 [Chloroflexi bacterium]|nr:hypothetical protein [Chloroflexota bacterium]